MQINGYEVPKNAEKCPKDGTSYYFVLLSAHANRVIVSRMRDFKI